MASLLGIEALGRTVLSSNGDTSEIRQRRNVVIGELAKPLSRPTSGLDGPIVPASAEALPRLLADPAHRFRVPHPYLGFVYDVRSNSLPERRGLGYPSITSDGFLTTRSGVHRDTDGLRVAVFGGSMAMLMTLQAEDVLRTELSKAQRFAGRAISIDCLALGGYKQPQQLIALSYFLAAGRRWDLIITMDGFNEVALPLAENIPSGVPLEFPRAWNAIAEPLVDSALLRQAAGIVELEDDRSRLARLFSAPVMASSAAANLIWARLDARRAAALAIARRAASNSRAGGSPRRSHVNADDLAAATELWVTASVLMAEVAQGAGAEFFHFLQPNLHDPAMTKPLSPAEVRLREVESPFQGPAVQGYPLLAAGVRRLRDQGIASFDLRRSLNERPEVAWTDNCCHVDQRGSEVLATLVARSVAAWNGVRRATS